MPHTRLHETASWTRISAQRRDPEIRASGAEFSKSFLTSHGVIRLLFKFGTCVGARWGSRGNCSFCREVDKVLESAPLGMGPFCALSYHFLCSFCLVRFLCIAFPTCIRTGALSQLRFGVCHQRRFVVSWTFCLFVWLRRLWVLAVFKYMAKFTLNYAKAPSSHRGAGGDGDVFASSLPPLAAYIRHFPLVPVQRQSIELPATTVGECRRRHSL